MNRIKELRLERKMKQVDLAEKLNLKAATISSWEVERTEPDRLSLLRMAEIFGVSIDYILGGDKKEKPTVVGSDDGKTVHLDISGLSPENRAKVEEYALLLLGSQRKPEE